MFLKLEHRNVSSPGGMPIDFSEVSVEMVREDAEGPDLVGAVSNRNKTAQVTIGCYMYLLMYLLIERPLKIKYLPSDIPFY